MKRLLTPTPRSVFTTMRQTVTIMDSPKLLANRYRKKTTMRSHITCPAFTTVTTERGELTVSP